MTLETDFIHIFIQQLAMRGCVRVVAFRTIATLHRGMDKPAFEFFLEPVMALQTEISRGSGFQSVLVLLRKNERNT